MSQLLEVLTEITDRSLEDAFSGKTSIEKQRRMVEAYKREHPDNASCIEAFVDEMLAE